MVHGAWFSASAADCWCESPDPCSACGACVMPCTACRLVASLRCCVAAIVALLRRCSVAAFRRCSVAALQRCVAASLCRCNVAALHLTGLVGGCVISLQRCSLRCCSVVLLPAACSVAVLFRCCSVVLFRCSVASLRCCSVVLLRRDASHRSPRPADQRRTATARSGLAPSCTQARRVGCSASWHGCNGRSYLI